MQFSWSVRLDFIASVAHCCYDAYFIFLRLTNSFYSNFSLESKNLHEVREAFDITSLNGFFPDQEHPEFRQAVSDLVPKLCLLSQRLLRCLGIALGILLLIENFKLPNFNPTLNQV